MSARVPTFPEVQSRFLSELLQAFKARSKAIKHRVVDWQIELSQDADSERIDMDFDYFGPQIRFAAWDDGVMWFRSCKSSKRGWAFNFAFHLSANDRSPSRIVETFRNSLILSDSAENAITFWSDFLPKRDWSVG